MDMVVMVRAAYVYQISIISSVDGVDALNKYQLS